MNRDRFTGMWKQFSGKLKEEWCRLIDDAPGVVTARREQCAGWNQEGRGIWKETAARQLNEFLVRNRNWDMTNR